MSTAQSLATPEIDRLHDNLGSTDLLGSRICAGVLHEGVLNSEINGLRCIAHDACSVLEVHTDKLARCAAAKELRARLGTP